jgi:hypothetical protein
MGKKRLFLILGIVTVFSILLLFVINIYGLYFFKNPVSGKVEFVYPGKKVVAARWDPASGQPKPSWVVLKEGDKSSGFGDFTNDEDQFSKYLQFKKNLGKDTVVWDWKLGYLVGTVISIDKEKKEIVMDVKYPAEKPFSNINESGYNKFTVKCSNPQTYEVDSTGEVLVSDNFDLFAKNLTVPFEIVSKCTDAICTSISDICVISQVGGK